MEGSEGAKEKPAPLHEIANQASPRKVVPGVSASCAVTGGNAAKRIISDRLESSEYGHDPDHVGQILKKLAAELELLPGQLRAAARFVLANPKDVALKTMREQAGLAGVSHSTMVRFAEWLGFDGYTELKAVFADWLRQNADNGSEQVSFSSEPISADVENAADWLRWEVARLGAQPNVERNLLAADLLAGARRVISVGIGPQLAVANHFAEVLRSLGHTAIVFDAAQQSATHGLKDIGPRDAILAISMEPFTKQTLAVARYARRRGAQIVAIVDGPQSPIEQYAQAIIVTGQSESRFQSMAPIIASVEILAALVEQSVISSESKE
jgi:DNA-binding MurR/RpiR family transcriptional regulator